MAKPKGVLPCEMGQSCDNCDALQCPLISKRHKDIVFSVQKLKQFDQRQKESLYYSEVDGYDDDEEDYEDL